MDLTEITLPTGYGMQFLEQTDAQNPNYNS